MVSATKGTRGLLAVWLVVILALTAACVALLGGGMARAWNPDPEPVATTTYNCGLSATHFGGVGVGPSATTSIRQAPSCVFAQAWGDGSVAVAWGWFQGNVGAGAAAPTVVGWYVYRAKGAPPPLTGLAPGDLLNSVYVPWVVGDNPGYHFLDSGYCAGGTTGCPLDSSTQYWYSVRTLVNATTASAAYFGRYSIVTTFPPRPVRGVSVNSTTYAGGAALTVYWQKNPEPNIVSYKVYVDRKSIGVTVYASNYLVNWNATSYTSNSDYTCAVGSGGVTGATYYCVYKNITPFTDYYFRVLARDNGGSPTICTAGCDGIPSVVKWGMSKGIDNPNYYPNNGVGWDWAPPHAYYTDTTKKCVLCHGIHSAPAFQPDNLPRDSASYLLKVDSSVYGGSTVAGLCFTCHDGTGSNRNVWTEFGDARTVSTVTDSTQLGSYKTSRPDLGSVHPVLASSSGGSNYYGYQLRCTNCHSAHLEPYFDQDTTAQKVYQSAYTPRLLSPRLGLMVGKQPFFRHKGDGVCYTCHGIGTPLLGGSREREFEQSAHKRIIRTGNAVEPPMPTLIRCLLCHKPHGSPNLRIKKLEMPWTCLDCHGPDQNTPVYHLNHSLTASSGVYNSAHEYVYGQSGFNNIGGVTYYAGIRTSTGWVYNRPPDIYSLLTANPFDADSRHDMFPVRPASIAGVNYASDDPVPLIGQTANLGSAPTYMGTSPATLYQDGNAKHYSGERDPWTRITCTNCHNPHTVQPQPGSTTTESVYRIMADPFGPSPSNWWGSVTSMSYQSYLTPTTNAGSSNLYYQTSGTLSASLTYPTSGVLAIIGFCVRCHDNTLPTSSNTWPWAPPPSAGIVASDLGNSSNSRILGNLAHAWLDTTTSNTALGSPPSTNAMGYLRSPNTGTTRYGVAASMDWSFLPADTGAADSRERTIPCTVCHDPHGSPNPYRLKPFIKVKIASGQTAACGNATGVASAPCDTIRGPLSVFRFGTNGTPVDATLPGGPPVDIDWHFFCSACHHAFADMGYTGGRGNDACNAGSTGTDGTGAGAFPYACTRCHGHVKTGNVGQIPAF